MDNVINFRNEKPKPKPEQGSHGLEISEYTLTIGGDDYRVRRAADRETQGCFVTISDHAGKPVLVFSSTFPSDHIAQLTSLGAPVTNKGSLAVAAKASLSSRTMGHEPLAQNEALASS